MNTFLSISRNLKGCQICVTMNPKNREIVNPEKKPCVEFEIFKRWFPNEVKLLFITESPPRRESYYFYNEETMGNLKTELFKLLRIKADTATSGLTGFKERGFFLIDTIKCRCDKRVRSTIPLSIVKTCVRKFLQREIAYLKPREICVLGKTALIGLREVKGFGELKRYRIRNDCGKQLNLRGYDVVLCLFPSTQNKRYYPKIKEVFESLLCHL